CHNIHEDLAFARWRADALRLGFESSVALPLRSEGKTFGFLAIYATEPDAFDAGEVRVLTELANDLAFGLTVLRTRAESRALIDAIPQQIWSGPPDGTNDYVNARWRSETGLGLEDVRGDGWQTLLHPEDRDRVLKAWNYS